MLAKHGWQTARTSSDNWDRRLDKTPNHPWNDRPPNDTKHQTNLDWPWAWAVMDSPLNYRTFSQRPMAQRPCQLGWRGTKSDRIDNYWDLLKVFWLQPTAMMIGVTQSERVRRQELVARNQIRISSVPDIKVWFRKNDNELKVNLQPLGVDIRYHHIKYDSCAWYLSFHEKKFASISFVIAKLWPFL